MLSRLSSQLRSRDPLSDRGEETPHTHLDKRPGAAAGGQIDCTRGPFLRTKAPPKKRSSPRRGANEQRW